MSAFLAGYIGLANILPFLQAVTFNVAIGNADCHARNYSLLLPRTGDVELAPLYDLICTRLYPELDADAAQRVNGRWELDDISVDDLLAEATGWGLPSGVAETWVRATLGALTENLERAVGECVDRGGDPAVAAAVAHLVSGRLALLAA
jgi:serine/threonine-protein kinase HipA